MKIQYVNIKGFRNVPDMEKILHGSNIVLLADNTMGKSNFIRALKAALCGKLGPNAIKHGQERAEVELTLADFENETPIDGTEYRFKLTVKRDKESQETAKIEVWAPNGFKEVKKTIIGTIAGEIEQEEDFVALSRTEKGQKRQIEILRDMLDEEDRNTIQLFENKAQQAYDERTEVNREIKRIEGWIGTQGMDRQLVDQHAGKEKISVAELSSQLQGAVEHNNKIKGVCERIEERKSQAARIATDIRNAELEIEALQKKIEQLHSDAKSLADMDIAARAFLQQNQEINLEDFNSRIQDADRANQVIDRANTLRTQIDLLTQQQERSGELTALYESSKQAIADAIRDMQIFEGVTFDERSAYYRGKMVHPDILSTSEQMEFNIRLLIAQRSRVQAEGKNLADIIFVERGESFGLQKLYELQKAAKALGYQIVMEQVERGTEELKVEFMVDVPHPALADAPENFQANQEGAA